MIKYEIILSLFIARVNDPVHLEVSATEQVFGKLPTEVENPVHFPY